MQHEQLQNLVEQLATGKITSHDFMQRTSPALTTPKTSSPQPWVDASSSQEVTLDLDRQQRCGFPEVIYGEGKSSETIATIANRLLANGQKVLATRINETQADYLQQQLSVTSYNSVARTLRIDPESSASEEANEERAAQRLGQVAILSAGTSDQRVAEEAQETLLWMGVNTRLIQDVGVAGPHRLPERLPEFSAADALVVVAGMEGALPSVVGGYVDCPIFAVPTSVGYGANLGGIAALLSMLNSCAANVAVVNIDAGFKAGYLAGLVATKKAPQ